MESEIEIEFKDIFSLQLSKKVAESFNIISLKFMSLIFGSTDFGDHKKYGFIKRKVRNFYIIIFHF